MIFLSESLIEDEVNLFFKIAMQEVKILSRCFCPSCNEFKAELEKYYASKPEGTKKPEEQESEDKKDEEYKLELRRKYPCQINTYNVLSNIDQLFKNIKIKEISEYNLEISKYISNVKSKIPGLELNEAEILKDIEKKINNLSEAKRIAEDGYIEFIGTENKPGKDPFWTFSVLKSIRDLLIQDIDIKGKKQVESYFPIYSKILDKKDLSRISEIIKNCQQGMLLCYRRPVVTNDFQKIIYNKEQPIIIPLTEKDKLMQVMDQQSPIGNLMFSSAVHSIQSGGVIAAKKIDTSHYLPPALDKDSTKDSLPLLNEIFQNINISFQNVNDLENKKLKLKLYTELTGDNEITFPFNRLVNEIIAYKKRGRKKKEEVVNELPAPIPTSPQDEERKRKEKIQSFINSNSYKKIEENKEKLKTIITLKFDAITINTLQKYKIVQVGSDVKLMEDPGSTSLPNLTEDDLKILSSKTSISQENIIYFLESLSLEINNLLFKIN
jgi:hypothetical protein